MKKSTRHQGSKRAHDILGRYFAALERSLSHYETRKHHNEEVCDATRAFLTSNSQRTAVANAVRDTFLSQHAFASHNLATTLLPGVQALLDSDPRAFLAAATGKRSRTFKYLVALGLEEVTHVDGTRGATDMDYAVRGLMRAVEELAANIDADEFYSLLHKSPVRIFKKAVEHVRKHPQLIATDAAVHDDDHDELGGQLHHYRTTSRVMGLVHEAILSGSVTKDNAHIWLRAATMHFCEGVALARVALYVQQELEKLGASRPTHGAWKTAVYRAFRSIKRFMRAHFDPKDLLDAGQRDEQQPTASKPGDDH